MGSQNSKTPIYDRAYYTGMQLKDAVQEEQDRIRAILMRKDAEAKGAHNYYLCLAVELFGEKHV